MRRFLKPRSAPVHAVGIDISDGSLELVNAGTNREGGLLLLEHARVILEPHTIVHGQIQHTRTLANAFQHLFAEARFKPEGHSVVSALPDGQVLTKAIPLATPAHALTHEYLEGLADSFYKELGYRLRKPVIQWTVHKHDHKQSELILYATEQAPILAWSRFYRSLGLSLAVMEMESHALARALLQPIKGHDTALIIDFGYRQTNIALFDAKGLRYSHTIEGGGLALTNRIAHEQGISLDEAEQLKYRHNLTEPTDEPVQITVRNHYMAILEAACEALQRISHPISRIVLTGGGSALPGVRHLTHKVFGYPTERGLVTKHVSFERRVTVHKSGLPKKIDSLYAGAFGLALRGMTRESLWRGVNFLT